LASTTSACW
jgi:hypothetical protein